MGWIHGYIQDNQYNITIHNDWMRQTLLLIIKEKELGVPALSLNSFIPIDIYYYYELPQ